MRILHTSDWHLGRSFHRENLLQAQAAFVDHLIATVRTERVDVVAVAGDLYDRALPPVDAVTLFDDTLARIRGTGAQAVLISGNHDSMVRMAYGSRLMAASGIHLCSSLDNVGAPVVIDHPRGPVAFYALPYLEPEVVRHAWDLPDRSHKAAVGHAMDLVRADLAERPRGTRSVVLSHAFVTGGEPSDSERDISVGGAAHVPVGVFDGVDYTALGHLHGRQRMSDTVRYSGSPLAYSFSEEHQTKGYWLVDLDPNGAAHTEFVAAPVPRTVARIRGPIESLLTDPAWELHTGHWLQVTLTDPVRPAAPMERLRRRFPHTLNLAFDPEDGGPADDRTWAQRTAGRGETDLVRDFVDWARGTPATAEEDHLIQRAFEEIRTVEAAR